MMLTRSRTSRLFTGLALLVALAGCAAHEDPNVREGTWRPEGVNEANIAAMVVDKHHLVEGVGDDESLSALSTAAIARLLADKVKPLPSTEIGPVSAKGSGN